MTLNLRALDDCIAALKEADGHSHDLNEDIALACGIWKVWLSKHRYWIFDGPDDQHFHWPIASIPHYSNTAVMQS